MAGHKKPSLNEFAAQQQRLRRVSFWSLLPEEVRAEVIESSAPSSVVVDWLIELGWTDATVARVDPYRRRDRRRGSDAL
jgi:hypothetical protein